MKVDSIKESLDNEEQKVPVSLFSLNYLVGKIIP